MIVRVRHRGTTSWWNEEEGFGVITSPDFVGDIWVHFSFLKMDGYRSLHEGQAVEFKDVMTPSLEPGYPYQARWVRPL
jgi:CspA family cold shock protein